MRIHDAYVLRLFLKVLLLCILSFSLVFVLADLFEKIDNFIDHQATTSSIVRYYAYKLPDIIRLTLPVDLLLATLFSLGVLARNHETVALLASGVSMLRLCLPLLIVGTLCVGASVALSELVAPYTNARMTEIRRVEIEKRPPLDATIRRGFTYRGARGYLYYVQSFNTETNRMTGVVVHRYKDGKLVARLDARTAEWSEDHWEFQDGYYRLFEPQEHTQAFRTTKLPELRESPADLARLEPDPKAMNYTDLRRHIETVRQGGGDATGHLVSLYEKVSYPLTNLILTVLGIGLSATKRKTSLATGFGLTLTIAFSYLAISELSGALGQNKALPPLVAAWISPMLFGTAGFVLLARIDR